MLCNPIPMEIGVLDISGQEPLDKARIVGTRLGRSRLLSAAANE